MSSVVASSASVTGSVVSGSGVAVSGSVASTSGSATTSIPQTAAAGGLSMTQPPQTASASFYKIAPGNSITFGWNFTSLYVQPATLTVSAVCTQNGYTYRIGGENNDGILPGTATQVIWNPYEYQQLPGAVPLAQETYTLHINDERGPGVGPTGGLFSPYSGLKFGLYKPGEATPLTDWKCADCNAASSTLPHPIFVAMFATIIMMVLGGWRVLRREAVA